MTPRLPETRSTRVRQQQDAGTWMALVLVVLCGGGLLGLISLIMPDVLQMAVVGAAFPAFIAVHYFTWGRWLSQAAARQRTAENRSADVGSREEDHLIGDAGTK